MSRRMNPAMNLVMGRANPVLQKRMLELAFGPSLPTESAGATAAIDESVTGKGGQANLAWLDQALTEDTLSGEQLRVLPLLYRSTSLAGLSAESRAKVISIYKHTLCRNMLMLNRLGQIQLQFRLAGFEEMIGLKGLPAIAYIGLGMGARPMADVDVLVPGLGERLPEAISILQAVGYRMKDVGMRFLAMTSPEGLELDLHWYVHDWALGSGLVSAVRAHADEQPFQSGSFLIPCREHHLAHTLAHGVLTKTLTYDARWVFDFLAVFLRGGALDEGRFAQFANSVAAPQRLRDGLQGLIDETPASVDMDRACLSRLKRSIHSNRAIVTWAYNQTPTPNLPVDRLGDRIPRLDWFKQTLIAYWLIPKRQRVLHGISFAEYYAQMARLSALNQYYLKMAPQKTPRDMVDNSVPVPLSLVTARLSMGSTTRHEKPAVSTASISAVVQSDVNGLWWFSKKLIFRGPVFLFRLVMGR